MQITLVKYKCQRCSREDSYYITGKIARQRKCKLCGGIQVEKQKEQHK